MTALVVTKSALRRYLLQTQGLFGPAFEITGRKVKSDDVMRVIRALECVQLDPVAAVERNQHLALYARLPKYRPQLLGELLKTGRVFEYWANAACVIPMEDYPAFEHIRRRRLAHLQSEMDQLSEVTAHILGRLEREGPLPSKAFESTDKVHGYWDNTVAKTKATSHALNLLNDTGILQVVGREGTTRFFDLRERAIPASLLDDAKHISEEESKRLLVDKYIRAYRVIDTSDNRFGWQKTTAGERQALVDARVTKGELIEVAVADVKRRYYILAEDEEMLRCCAGHADGAGVAGDVEVESIGGMTTSAKDSRISFLPPLDNLLWRRSRIEDLFDFTYTWEVYIPPAKRQYGYYTMPILFGDRLIGRIDPRLLRDTKRMDILILQIEPAVKWTKRLEKKVTQALETFAKFHGADVGEVAAISREAHSSAKSP